MNLKLERPIVFFDIESTGLNIATDSIVELSFVKVFPGGEEKIKTWRVCPWNYEKNQQMPMNPSAEAVHGISNEEVANCPKFYEVVSEVVEWLKDSDLSGFNSTRFDLPMLAEEIEKARNYKHLNLDINLHDKKMIDVQTIYHKMEPRNLRAAYRFYCGGEDFDNAHSAEADTIATYKVLKGQLDKYNELKNDIDSLAAFGNRSKNIDFAGRLQKGDDGEAYISFGKHKGKKARDIYAKEPSYFNWIMQGTFSFDTKRQFQLLMKQYENEKRKPLKGDDLKEAASQLKNKFQGLGQGKHS